MDHYKDIQRYNAIHLVGFEQIIPTVSDDFEDSASIYQD